MILYLSGQKKNGANETKPPFGTRIKIMGEEHLVDPPIKYIGAFSYPPASEASRGVY